MTTAHRCPARPPGSAVPAHGTREGRPVPRATAPGLGQSARPNLSLVHCCPVDIVRKVNAGLTLTLVAAIAAASAALHGRLPSPLAIHWTDSTSDAQVNGTASLAAVTGSVLAVVVLAGLLGHVVRLLSPVVVGTAAAVTAAASIYGPNEGLETAAAARPPSLEDMQSVAFAGLLAVVAVVWLDARRRGRETAPLPEM